MKRTWVLFVLFAAVMKICGMVPFESRDVSELVPIEALTVDKQNGQVRLNGGECQGSGEDWAAALADLKESGEGEVFLSTAEYVILSPAAADLLPDLLRSGDLRPAAQVCVSRGGLPEPQDAADYLSSHEAGVTVQSLQAAMLQKKTVYLPILEQTEGGLRLRGINR